jgi:hypothetical protein
MVSYSLPRACRGERTCPELEFTLSLSKGRIEKMGEKRDNEGNMAEIKVNKKSEMGNKWFFEVLVGDMDFLVEVEKDYWQKLTSEKMAPEDLVKKSFEFLLAREPKESILRSFNLKLISNYFPEYEGEIARLPRLSE